MRSSSFAAGGAAVALLTFSDSDVERARAVIAAEDRADAVWRMRPNIDTSIAVILLRTSGACGVDRCGRDRGCVWRKSEIFDVRWIFPRVQSSRQ